MTAHFTILGVGLSQKQAAMLCELVREPMAMDGLTGDGLEALAKCGVRVTASRGGTVPAEGEK